jgi:hypothetical protein
MKGKIPGVKVLANPPWPVKKTISAVSISRAAFVVFVRVGLEDVVLFGGAQPNLVSLIWKLFQSDFAEVYKCSTSYEKLLQLPSVFIIDWKWWPCSKRLWWLRWRRKSNRSTLNSRWTGKRRNDWPDRNLRLPNESVNSADG